MSEAEAFFVSEAVKHARTLPYPEMIRFLRGMSYAIDANPSYHVFNDLYISMTRCDEQIELIASGQLKLDLEIVSRKRKPAARATRS